MDLNPCNFVSKKVTCLAWLGVTFFFFFFLNITPLFAVGYISEVKVPYKLRSHKGSTNKIRHMIQITFIAEKTEKRRRLLRGSNPRPCAPVRLVASLG